MQHSAAAGDAPADMKKKPSLYDKLKHRKINTSFIKKLSAQEISDLSLELQERCVNFSGQSEDYLQLKNIIAEVLAELPNKLTNENGLQTHKTDLQNYFLVLVTRQRRKEREVTEEPRPTVIDAYTTIANIGKRILYQNKNMRFQPPRSVDEVQMITKLMEKNVADLHALKVSDSDEDSLSYREDYLVLCTDALEHLSREMERIRRDSSDKRDTPSPREHCAGNAQHSVMPAVNAQRPVMPAVNAQHPVMPAVNAQHPVMPAVNAQHPVMPAVNAQPPLMPAVNSPVMPAVIAQSPVMPAVNYAQPPVMPHAPNHYYYQQPSPFYPPYPRLYQHNAMQFHMMQRQLAVQAQLAAQAQFAAQQAHATYLHYHQNLQAMMHFGGNNVGNEPIVQIAEVESPMEEKKEINLTPQHQEKGSVGNERSENVQVVVESPMEEKKESNPEHGEDSVGNEKSESVLQIDEIETPVEEKKESNTADNADHNLQDSPDVCSTFETPVSLESESTETNPLPEKSELLPTEEVVEAEIENDLKNCETLVCEMEQKTMGFWGPLENLPALQDAIEKLKTKVLCDKACGPVEAASLVEKLEHCQQLLMNRVAMMESALDTDSDDEDFYSVNSKDSVDKVCHVTPEGSSDAGDDVLTQEIVEPVEKNAAPTKQEEDCDKIVRNSEEVCVDESLDLLADNLDGPDNQEPQNKHGSSTKQPEEEDCSEIVQDSVLDSEEVCVDESLDLLAVDNLDGPGNQEAQNVQKSSDDIQRMANIHQMGQWFSDAFVPPHFVWLPQFFGSPQMCVADPSWPGQPQVQTDEASSGFHTMPASPPALTIQLGSTCNTITGLQGAANIQAHHGPVSSHRGLPATNTMNPSQPMSVTQQAVHKPLTASMLVDLPLGKQKQMFGERLFPLLQQMYPELAAKITGMLLELDNSELLHLLEHHESLRAKVEEAVAMLQAHQAKQSNRESNKSLNGLQTNLATNNVGMFAPARPTSASVNNFFASFNSNDVHNKEPSVNTSHRALDAAPADSGVIKPGGSPVFVPQTTMEGLNSEVAKLFSWVAEINKKVDQLAAGKGGKIDREKLLALRLQPSAKLRPESLPKLEVVTKNSFDYGSVDLSDPPMPKYQSFRDKNVPFLG